MRVRMGRGLRCTSFHGHFMIRSNDLMALPTIDPDKAILVQIGHEEQVVTHNVTYLQCALLYTTSMGERRIRVHTLAIPVVSDVGQMFKTCDGPAAAAVLAKLAAEKIRTSTLRDTTAILNRKISDILKEYRRCVRPRRKRNEPTHLPRLSTFPRFYALVTDAFFCPCFA